MECPRAPAVHRSLDYAETLKIPFVFSSNGDGFVFHDRTGVSNPREATLSLDEFPSPEELWARFRAWKGLDSEAERIFLQDYFDDGGGKAPRYYQVNAINAAIEAIAKGQDRVLLVMATGTGKTYTAFQIIWRLWKAGRKKRNRDVGLIVEDVIGTLSLPPRDELSAHNDPALREANLLSNLQHLIPARTTKGRGDKLGANIPFREDALVHAD